MIALGIRYLTGYSVSMDLSRQRAEWPPHPARLFMAMAAAFFETGSDAGERAALEWLEAQPPPDLCAPPAQCRETVEVYVPVNDSHGGIGKRSRQPRTFPTVRPDSDSVYFLWQGEPGRAIRDSLESLCGKVTRLGHSSSLVQMWVVEAGREPEPNLYADSNRPGEGLRVPSAGLLNYLEECFNGMEVEQYFELQEEIAAAKGKKAKALKEEAKSRFPNGAPQATRPMITTWGSYSKDKPTDGDDLSVARSVFEAEFVVLSKLEGQNLGLESTLQLTSALRQAVMKYSPDPPPEWISGHTETGEASSSPHVALFPLAFVGAEHADGHVMGLGIAVPRVLSGVVESGRAAALRTCLGPLLFEPATGESRSLTLWRGRVWKWTVERETRERPPLTLARSTWNGPSTVWASVTPVVLHHHPKKNRVGAIEKIVRDAFRTAFFPEPTEVLVGPVAAHRGAVHVKDMPPFDAKHPELSRYQTHVIAVFDQPVEGPMLIGRGRYRGYGLLRPLAGGIERWR